MKMSLTCHVERESVPNLEVMLYHTRAEMSRAVNEHFYRPLRDSSMEYLKKVGPLGAQIVRGLMRIKGIKEVTIQPYGLQISKAKTYGWDELDPQIRKVIRRAIINHPLEQFKGWSRTAFRVSRFWTKVKRFATNLVFKARTLVHRAQPS